MAILLGSGIGDLDLWANESTASFKSKKTGRGGISNPHSWICRLAWVSQ